MPKAKPAAKAERLSLRDLKANPKNPRRMTGEKLAMLKKSLEEFGDLSGHVFNRTSGQLVGGHQRGKVLPPDARVIVTKRFDTPTSCGTVAVGYVEVGDERFGYREVEWGDAKEKAANLAANQHSGEWDIPQLGKWLVELKSVGFDMGLTGFTDREVAIHNRAVIKAGLTDDDAVPEPPKDPTSKPGDLYVLGEHRLMCGDSTNIEHVERLMGGEKADICFTSPPYNAGSLNVKGQSRTGKKYNSFDDNQSEAEFRDFLTGNLNCIFAVCREVFYNIGLVEANKRVIIDVLDQYREQFKDIIYWKKSSVAPHIQPGIVNNLVEFILCFGNGKRKFEGAQFHQGTYWNVIEGPNAGAGNEYAAIHKATFPVYLPENVITNFCPPKGLVLDTFGGTGTTMIAAEKLDRRARLMEIDPKYCDVIISRWEAWTGRKAELVATEEPA